MWEDPASLTQILDSEGFANLAPQVKVALFMGALVFLSAGLVTLTAFTRIIIVLSFVRRALSTQEIPPTPVLIGLALFLTLFVMAPTLSRIEQQAVQPYLQQQIDGSAAWLRGTAELKTFMLQQTRVRDLALFVELSGLKEIESAEAAPLHVLIPAFIISELKTAFIMGFCLYLPFILVDLVVSVILMSLGMMMMPPVVISTPFKILLFVLVDGWQLIARAVTASFS